MNAIEKDSSSYDEKLREIKSFYEDILNKITVGIWISNKDDKIFFTNTGMALIILMEFKRIHRI